MPEPSGCLVAIIRLLLGKPPSKDDAAQEPPRLPETSASKVPSYAAVDALMTPAERSFFGVLHKTHRSKYLLFSKVRLADVLNTATKGDRSAFNKIASKHLDFLLCDPKTTQPLLAIELDDSTHKRRDRSARDDFLEAAMSGAGLPLLRVPASYAYGPEELTTAIADLLAAANS